MKTFPRDISPMKATLSDHIPRDESQYGFEYKWDGYRALCFWDGKEFLLKSRNALDLTEWYPELKALEKNLSRPVILDGEIIALNHKAQPDFGLLQQRAGVSDARIVRMRMKKIPVHYMLFDILHWDGHALISLPYTERRALLEKLNLSGPNWKTPPFQSGDGVALYEVAKKFGFEGIVAKKLDSRYEPGRRSPHWIKVKFSDRQELVIGGWTPGSGSNEGGLASLLLGYYGKGKDKQTLFYAGNVGTGFDTSQRFELKKLFEKKRRATNPFKERIPFRDANFIDPVFVAEIEFRGWTRDLKVRQASFKGLRKDKNPKEVVREEIA
jgi:bifunctional non-homologous end joining protein LigD